MLLTHLADFKWPHHLGQTLVEELCRRHQFDFLAAGILRNCVNRLSLNNSAHVTRDLVHCLCNQWSDLVEIQLGNLSESQVTVDNIAELDRLVNLQILGLNHLQSVCDQNIAVVTRLPRLLKLGLSSTKVTDVGWLQLVSQFKTSTKEGCRDSLPLCELQLAGMGSSLTDRGLVAVVQLFPRLVRLSLAASHITGEVLPTDYINPLRHLRFLDLTDCSLMTQLPAVLVPPLIHDTDESTTTVSVLERKGIRWVCVIRCDGLILQRLIRDLTAHPVHCLMGIESLPQMTADLLRSYLNAGFPLTEVALLDCNSDWTVGHHSSLTTILDSLPVSSLVVLSLPKRPVGGGDSELSIGQALATSLQRLTGLESLDLGGQAYSPVLVSTLQHCLTKLRGLRRIVFTLLPRHLEDVIRMACPEACVVHVQRYV